MTFDDLPRLCDKLQLHLACISEDLSFHFKYLDVVFNRTGKYLDNG